MNVFAIIFTVWAGIFLLTAILSAFTARRRTAGRRTSPRRTVSSDGHRVPASQDLTCETKYGHDHGSSNFAEKRYIVHEEPEDGYVVLNGVKRKIRDCKYL